MLKPYLNPLIIIGITSMYHKSFSFDPVSVAMASTSATNLMKGMEKIDESADVGFALTELLEELGIESGAEESLEGAITSIEKLNSKAKELKWAQEEFQNSLNQDVQKGKSLTYRIKAMKTALQASKRIAVLMGFRPKAGEKAVRIQEIKINTMILEELQAMRQGMFLSYLEDKEARTKREIFLQEILDQEKRPRFKGHKP